MKAKILIVVVIFLLITLLAKSTVSYKAPPFEELTPQEMTMPELVDYYAWKHGVDEAIMNKVVKCESNYNPKAVNWSDSHKLSKGSHGISQFSQQTFEMYAKKMGKDYTDPYNPKEALDVMGFMLANGQGSQWTCFRSLQG